MKRYRVLAAAAAAPLAIGTVITMAPSASAAGHPITWNQSVAVPSATSPCPTTSAADATVGWTDWTRSWAQWPNAGTGGNVCDRSITWAYAGSAVPSAYPSAGCVPVTGTYVDFGGGWSLAKNALQWSDSGCTEFSGDYFPLNLVYAPAGFDPDSLCVEAFHTGLSGSVDGGPVYACVTE